MISSWRYFLLFLLNSQHLHMLLLPCNNRDSKERKKHASDLDKASHMPMYVLYKDNEIVQVWVANDDDSTYLNVKKGEKRHDILKPST